MHPHACMHKHTSSLSHVCTPKQKIRCSLIRIIKELRIKITGDAAYFKTFSFKTINKVELLIYKHHLTNFLSIYKTIWAAPAVYTQSAPQWSHHHPWQMGWLASGGQAQATALQQPCRRRKDSLFFGGQQRQQTNPMQSWRASCLLALKMRLVRGNSIGKMTHQT